MNASPMSIDALDYRETNPLECGFENEKDQREAMHEYCSHIMQHDDPETMSDTLLVLANVSETKSLLYSETDPAMSDWYYRLSRFLRTSLSMLQQSSVHAFPDVKLEDPLLYFPEPSRFH